MKDVISNKIYKILPYLSIFILILYFSKINLIFKSNGQVRNFGVGYDADGDKKTLFTIHYIIICVTIFLYVYF